MRLRGAARLRLWRYGIGGDGMERAISGSDDCGDYTEYGDYREYGGWLWSGSEAVEAETVGCW